MRLLVVTPDFPPEAGGPASASWELLQRLPPEVRVEVVSFSPEKREKVSGVFWVQTSSLQIWRQFRLFLKCLLVGRRTNIFLLMEPGVVGPAGLLAAKILGKRAIVKYFGDPVWEEKQRRRETDLSITEFLSIKQNRFNLRSLLSWLVVKYSDKIITPFDFLAQILEEYYGLARDKIVVLHSPSEIPGTIPVNRKSEWGNYVRKIKNVLG
jgi:hypothetical protein